MVAPPPRLAGSATRSVSRGRAQGPVPGAMPGCPGSDRARRARPRGAVESSCSSGVGRRTARQAPGFPKCDGGSGAPNRNRDALPNTRQLLGGDPRGGGVDAAQRHAGDVMGQRPACRIGAVVGRRFDSLRERPVRESLIPGQGYDERVGVRLRKQLVILDHHRGTQLPRLGQGAAAPINHHDATGRMAAHGRSVGDVPSSSSSLRASGWSVRWATTRSPSARIAARRTRRASASAMPRTSALSPLPCPRLLPPAPLGHPHPIGSSASQPYTRVFCAGLTPCGRTICTASRQATMGR